MIGKHWSALAALFLISACATSVDTGGGQAPDREGAFVVAYSTNNDIRRDMEDQLVADLQVRNMIAHASYLEIPELRAITGDRLLARANAHNALAVLLINQVAADERGLINNPVRTMSDYSDLTAFYEYARMVEESFVPGRTVFAEVNLFVIDGDGAQLAWSETTWSFEADGAGGAIRGISESVADQLQAVRQAYRARID